jgi:nucleoside-diphosphate-sugar epimerase
MSLRVFITGATGYIGRAVALRLVRAGHEVYGLGRNAERGAALASAGVRPVFGDLSDPGTFLGTLQNCDAVVHAAFDPQNTAAQDQRALEAFRVAIQDGRVRRLLYTSGVWVHGSGNGRVIDENLPLEPLEIVRWRAAHEDVAMDFTELEAAVTIFRPGTVYGESRGLIGHMFEEARDSHFVTYPGDGSQTWALVHCDDVAEAYALALEHAKGGQRYLLSDESQFTVKEIAGAVARATGVETRPWPRESVIEKLGAYGEALLLSQKVSAAKARRELGWVPRHSSFVNEAEALHREWQSYRGTPVS